MHLAKNHRLPVSGRSSELASRECAAVPSRLAAQGARNEGLRIARGTFVVRVLESVEVVALACSRGAQMMLDADDQLVGGRIGAGHDRVRVKV